MTWLVLLHILGAVLFVGNIVTAAFWKIRAERSGDIRHMHRVAQSVMAADYGFTLPGITLIVGTGIWMAHQGGYSLAEINWLTVSLALFSLAGVIWMVVLIPSQRRMIRESELSARQGALTAAYRQASRRWDVYGVITTVIALGIMVFMVVKPM